MSGTPKVYLISSQNGSGESGTVVLTPQGDKTQVDVALAGAPSGIPQPAHVHTGTCSNLDPAPKYPLAPVKDGVSSTVVNASLASLTGGGFAVNVHKSGDDIKTYVACGNLGA
jgi:Cu/Zn superoxide dismutase